VLVQVEDAGYDARRDARIRTGQRYDDLLYQVCYLPLPAAL